VDAQRLGRVVRTARHRLGWRQSDLAERAGASQDLVSLVERGFADHVGTYCLRQVLNCLDLELLGYEVRSRTSIVDRLLDEGHAALVGESVELLKATGWDVRPEVSYSRNGERGSYDVMAWYPATSSLLVVEVKTELVSVEATIRKLDEKTRLAGHVGRERFRWQFKTVSCLLILPRGSTAYRQIRRHASVIDLVLPARSRAARSWLRRPSGRLGAVLFVSDTKERRGRSRRLSRIRRTEAGVAGSERETRRGTSEDPQPSGSAASSTTEVRR
jgi:transcriptional regulator with XRE-family HTH domain